MDFFGSRRMETAPTSIEVILRPTQSQSDEPSDLRGSLSPTSVYSTWQSQAVTHPINNRARRCLTSAIKHKPLSERRIPYIHGNNRSIEKAVSIYLHDFLYDNLHGRMNFSFVSFVSTETLYKTTTYPY